MASGRGGTGRGAHGSSCEAVGRVGEDRKATDRRRPELRGERDPRGERGTRGRGEEIRPRGGGEVGSGRRAGAPRDLQRQAGRQEVARACPPCSSSPLPTGRRRKMTGEPLVGWAGDK